MATAAWWRETRDRFASLRTRGGRQSLAVFGTDMPRGGQRLAAFGTDLQGDTRTTRYEFRIVATAAGRAIGGLQDAAYEAWLTCLREKLQPLFPEYFSACPTVSMGQKPRTIPLSRIDPPRTGAKLRKHNGNDEKDGKGLDPGALIKAAEGEELYMVVHPRKGNRFVVTPAHYGTYAAYLALKRRSAKCVVREPKTSTSSRSRARRPSSTRRRAYECDVIWDVCQASVKLCALLDTEAFAETATRPSGKTSRASAMKSEESSWRVISAATKKRRRELVSQYKQADRGGPHRLDS